MPRAVLYVRGALCLVRGRTAVDDILRITGGRPLWSASGEGWVMDASYVNDYRALAQWEHEYVVVSPNPPKPRKPRA